MLSIGHVGRCPVNYWTYARDHAILLVRDWYKVLGFEDYFLHTMQRKIL